MRGLNQRFMGTSRTVAIAGILAVLLALASGACNRAPDSQFNLGVSYDTGDGVAQDKAEGVKWYRKAAEQGYASAQFNIGVCYYNGGSVMQSNSVAADWYYRAGQAYLNQGEREDALLCYDRIVGISPDHFLALRLGAEIYGEK